MEKVSLFLVGIVRVAIDQLGHHTAQRLDAERQRRHVEEQNVLHVALQHASLNGCANGDHLVRVDPLVGLATEQSPHGLLHLRHAGLPAHKHDLVDLGGREAGVLQRRLARFNRSLNEIVDHRLELGPVELDVEVLRTVLVGRDIGQIDIGLVRARELDLGLLCCVFEALEGETILAEVDALVLVELICQVVHDPRIEVLPTKECIAIGRLDLENAIADL